MNEAGENGVLTDYVRDLLSAEDQRRASLETRGIQVVTVSGALVTLLLGLAAVAVQQKDFRLGGSAAALLTAAAGAFALAALLAVATTVPQLSPLVSPDRLRSELPTYWDLGSGFAQKKVTATRLDQLVADQQINDRKGRALLAAVLVQVVAIALLVWAVAVLL